MRRQMRPGASDFRYSLRVSVRVNCGPVETIGAFFMLPIY